MSNMCVNDLMTAAKNRVAGRYDAKGLLLEIEPDSDILVVSCSGIVPPEHIMYAMENSSHQIKTSKIFICDSRNLWYYGGISGITSCFDSTVDLIGSLADMLGTRRKYAIGTSGGGYMSMATTAMLGFDRALAMSPQTTLSAEWRSKNGDDRWKEYIDRIYSFAEPYDICDLLVNWTTSKFHVLYPGCDDLDIAHAERLFGLDNVTMYRLDRSDHNVAAELRQRNLLQSFLEDFIQSNEVDVSWKLRRYAES